MVSSSSAASLLALIAGHHNDVEGRASPYPGSMGPTLVKIADPREDVESVVELLDEATHAGRRRNRFLAKRRMPGLVQEEDGTYTYAGRKCCGALTVEINRNLHVIAIPSEYQCTCGAVYRVQNTPREERRHG